MAFLQKSLDLINEINKVFVEVVDEATVRQLHYQLFTRGVIENTERSYKNWGKILTKARKLGLVDNEHIIDTSRYQNRESSWNNVADFFSIIGYAYKRNLWQGQETYVEVWVEKDAMRGIFEPITNEFDVFLSVGKGYPSHTNIVAAKERFNKSGLENHILYFGDFDPSGKDIPRYILSELSEMGDLVQLHEIALNPEQVKKYKLPYAPAKKTDTRTVKFEEKYGMRGIVEMDALSPKILQSLIKDSINKYIYDSAAFEASLMRQNTDRQKIGDIIDQIKADE